MIPLQSQAQFETLYKTTILKDPILIYFTAEWCGACKRLDWSFITEEFPTLTIYKCDVDENKYTAGYCGVKAMPSVIMMMPSKELRHLQSSDTAKLASWIKINLQTSK